MRKKISKSTNHKLLQASCYQQELSAHMWDLRTASSKTHRQWRLCSRGVLWKEIVKKRTSWDLGDEKDPRNYGCSLIALFYCMLSHRQHGTLDRMNIGFTQTTFIPKHSTSCLYCLFSWSFSFLTCKMHFLKQNWFFYCYEKTFFFPGHILCLEIFYINIVSCASFLSLELACISVSILLFPIFLCLYNIYIYAHI